MWLSTKGPGPLDLVGWGKEGFGVTNAGVTPGCAASHEAA